MVGSLAKRNTVMISSSSVFKSGNSFMIRSTPSCRSFSSGIYFRNSEETSKPQVVDTNLMLLIDIEHLRLTPTDSSHLEQLGKTIEEGESLVASLSGSAVNKFEGVGFYNHDDL